jgi:insulysin
MAVENENAEIVKARIDKRNYKRIVLRNSLQVLLISDPDTDKVSFLFDLRFFSI